MAAQPLPAIPATKRTLIVNTDSGQDDAIALPCAPAAPERLDVRAFIPSLGNMPLSIAEKNSRRVRD